jgi:hypothetical protein
MREKTRYAKKYIHKYKNLYSQVIVYTTLQERDWWLIVPVKKDNRESKNNEEKHNIFFTGVISLDCI